MPFATPLSLVLVTLLTVGCAARVMGDDELKSDDATDTMSDGDTGTPPSGPTTTPPSSSTTDPTVGPDPTSETATATDTGTDSGDDPNEPPCTPDDECMSDLDCGPGGICLDDCVCFGTPEPACDQAPSCEECFFCSIGSGGGCDDLFGTCLANPQCAALLQCQLDCQDPQCSQACAAAHPAGIDDFFNLVGCVVSVCAAACN